MLICSWIPCHCRPVFHLVIRTVWHTPVPRASCSLQVLQCRAAVPPSSHLARTGRQASLLCIPASCTVANVRTGPTASTLVAGPSLLGRAMSARSKGLRGAVRPGASAGLVGNANQRLMADQLSLTLARAQRRVSQRRQDDRCQECDTTCGREECSGKGHDRLNPAIADTLVGAKKCRGGDLTQPTAIRAQPSAGLQSARLWKALGRTRPQTRR